jgi:predicted  nucleic acid-binding Zn-ribbon protein
MTDTRVFENRREEVVTFIKNKITLADDSRATDMTRRYCLTNEIPATEQQINDIAHEANRRRMVGNIQILDARIVILRDRVVVLEDQAVDFEDRITTLEGQLIALNNKVNSYHP